MNDEARMSEQIPSPARQSVVPEEREIEDVQQEGDRKETAARMTSDEWSDLMQVVLAEIWNLPH